MKLLLDANVSWRLVKLLEDKFPGTEHADMLDLSKPPKDSEIWECALTNGYTIITNDDDFNILLQRKGFPPKVIMLKTGNQSTKYLSEILKKHAEEISDFISNPEYGLLEIY